MSHFNEEQLSKITNIVREVEKLNDVEKLLLYLRLPCGRAEASPATPTSGASGAGAGGTSSNASAEGRQGKSQGHKQSFDLFTKKSDQETTQTYTWILSHLEEDPNVSLPKQEVYDEYKAFCQANCFEPLCVADFGKAMKHAFPCIKPRRLGRRGNSRYCYSGLRKRYRLKAPSLPESLLAAQQAVAPLAALPLQQAGGGGGPQQRTCSWPAETGARLSCGYERLHSGSQSLHENSCSPQSNCSSNNNNNAAQHGAYGRQQQPAGQCQQPDCHLFNAAHGECSAPPPPLHLNAIDASAAVNLKIEPQTSQATPMQLAAVAAAASNNKRRYLLSSDGLQARASDNSTSSKSCYGVGQTLENNKALPQPNNGLHGHHQAHRPQHHLERLNVLQSAQSHQFVEQTNGGGAAAVAAHLQNLPPSASYQQRCQPLGLHRPGTPDDDDYVHNYQDLNRPIVSNSIPFSEAYPPQQGHHQPPPAPPSGAFVHYSDQPPPPQHSISAKQLGQQHTATSATNEGSATSSSQAQVSSAQANQMDYQHDAFERSQQQTASPSSADFSNQAFHFNHLHLANRMNSSNYDFCASPFQSPASTPYPINLGDGSGSAAGGASYQLGGAAGPANGPPPAGPAEYYSASGCNPYGGEHQV